MLTPTISTDAELALYPFSPSTCTPRQVSNASTTKNLFRLLHDYFHNISRVFKGCLKTPLKFLKYYLMTHCREIWLNLDSLTQNRRLNSRLFKSIKDYIKTVSWLFKDSWLITDSFKAISTLLKDTFKTMLRLLQDNFKYNFKDDFRTTKHNFTQLGTTQPQLVLILDQNRPEPSWSLKNQDLFKCFEFSDLKVWWGLTI